MRNIQPLINHSSVLSQYITYSRAVNLDTKSKSETLIAHKGAFNAQSGLLVR